MVNNMNAFVKFTPRVVVFCCKPLKWWYLCETVAPKVVVLRNLLFQGEISPESIAKSSSQ